MGAVDTSCVPVVVEVDAFHEFGVFIALDTGDLSVYFAFKYGESGRDFGIFRFSVGCLVFVRIEPDIYPFTRVGHVEVIVPGFFVHRIVRFVLVFIGFHGQEGVAEELVVVNAPTDGAIAVMGLYRTIVMEPFVVRIDEIPHGNFLGLGPYLKGERVQRKFAAIAFGAIVFVFDVADALIRASCLGVPRAFSAFDIYHGIRLARNTANGNGFTRFVESRNGFATLATAVHDIDHGVGFAPNTTYRIRFSGFIVGGNDPVTATAFMLHIHHRFGFTCHAAYSTQFPGFIIIGTGFTALAKSVFDIDHRGGFTG